MRVFVGIKLDSNCKLKLENIRNYLFENGVRGNYTAVNNIHLTLSFIGEVGEDKISKLKEIVKSISFNNLNIEVTSIEQFKTYLILRVQKSDELVKIQKEIVYKLNSSGFSVDTKDYFPHITLVRKPFNVEEGILVSLNKNIKMSSKVDKIILFESVRINNELKYIAL